MATAPGQDVQEKGPGDLRRNLEGAHKEVAQILYDFAKTARSFGFYARNNKAIARFLTELFESLTDFIGREGTLWLGVAADRFVFQGETVYFDADREGGLPFRLYRDGIRLLSISAGLDRAEMEDFLELLSRRPTTGHDAEEEDLVTLMWRRSFTSISYQAVEGFTHDLHAAGGFGEAAEQSQKGDTGQAIPRLMQQISGKKEIVSSRERGFENKGRGRVARSFADSGAEDILAEEFGGGEDDGAFADGMEGGQMAFVAGLWPGSPDYPLPLRGGLAELVFEELTEEEKLGLREELDHENEVGLLHLLDYCFGLCVHEPKYFQHEDFTTLLMPIRRHLVRARDLQTYRLLLRYLRGIAEGGVYTPKLAAVAAEMVKDCSSGEALTSLVAAASGNKKDESIVWDVLQQLLPDLETMDLLRLLGHSMSAQMATILAGTLVRRTGRDLSIYEQAIDGNDVALIFASLRCLDVLRTAEAGALVERATESIDPALKRAAVRILGRVAVSGSSARVFSRLLRDDDPAVRDETITAIDRQGDKRLGLVIGNWLEEEGPGSAEFATCKRLVLLMVDLDSDFSSRFLMTRLDASLTRKLGLGRSRVAAEWKMLAAEGLAAIGTEKCLAKLRLSRTRGGGEFKDLVTKLLSDKRREGSA